MTVSIQRCQHTQADGESEMQYALKENRKEMLNINCLNPWDCQMKRIYETTGIYSCLQANSGGGGRTDGVCYSIEGNTVDRRSGKNGCGWCADVSPTLNTQDKHAVCFRKVCKPGPDGKGERWEQDSISGTLNTFEFHSEVRTPEIICLEGNGARPSHKGDGYSGSGAMYTLNTTEQHAVCYSVDCRNLVINRGRSGTLQAHNLGGWSVNCTNPVMYERCNDNEDVSD